MMTPVYIAQYQGLSKTSRLIKFGTRFDYSHSAYFSLETFTVWESWGKGVCEAAPWEHHHPETQIDLYSLEVTVDQKHQIERFLAEQDGKKYDLPGVLGWPLPWVGQRTDRWFCSELIFAAFLSAEVVLLKQVKASRVSPGLLATSPLLHAAGTLDVVRESIQLLHRVGAASNAAEGVDRG